MEKTLGEHLQIWLTRNKMEVSDPLFVDAVNHTVENAIRDASHDSCEAGAPSIITPEMIRRGSSVLTELQDAGCYQGYVLEKVYLAMRGVRANNGELTSDR